MIEQQKILRVLRLIGLLSEKPYRTAKDLAILLETSPKTVYQYLKLLEELGYLVDKDHHNAYFIFEASKTDPNSLLPEELQLVNQLIDSIQANNPLRDSIRKKLYLASTLVPLANDLIDRHMAKIVQLLAVAIQENRQVRLLRYQSATSEQPRDRVVDPQSLQKNNSQLVAFDVDLQEIRHFKVKRIEDVSLLDTKRTFDSDTYPTDIFGFATAQSWLLKLQMTRRAYQLLVEEFPESKPYVSSNQEDQKKPYRFVYDARSLIGIGRFILGLPGEIVVESPLELTEYLKKRVTEYFFTETVNGVR